MYRWGRDGKWIRYGYGKIREMEVQNLKIWNRDNTAIVFLFLILAFTVYGLSNNYYSLLIIGPSLFLFFKSNNDYFWLAFFTLIFFHPIGLFSEATSTATHRLPLLTLISGFSFSTEDVILIVIVLKALLRSEWKFNILNKPLKLIFFYALLLILIAKLVHQTSLSIMINQIRDFSYFFLIIGYNNLIKNEEQFFKMIMLILPFVFLNLIDAFYFFSTGDYLMSIIYPDHELRYATLGLQTGSGFNARYLTPSFILILFSLIGALVINSFSNNKNKIYLFLVACLSYFIIVITGTRSWSVIAGFVMIGYIFKTFKSSKIAYIIVVALLLIPGYHFISKTHVAEGVSSAFQRIGSLSTIGNQESMATQSIEYKMATHMKRDIENIKKNPLTGWGFTEIKGGEDAGNFGLIAEVGFVGFILFVFFWIRITILLRWGIKQKMIPRVYREMFYLLLLVFIGLLISHFTTNRIFGLMYFPVFLSLFIVMINKVWLGAYTYYKESS